MMHVIQQALSLIDALGDAGTGLVIIAAGCKSIRALVARHARHHLPPTRRQ